MFVYHSGNWAHTTVAIGPIPPDVEKISGEKEPCSTSLILSSLDHLFSCSFLLYH